MFEVSGALDKPGIESCPARLSGVQTKSKVRSNYIVILEYISHILQVLYESFAL